MRRWHVVVGLLCVWVLWAKGVTSPEVSQRLQPVSATLAAWQAYSAHATKGECEAEANNKDSIKRALLEEQNVEDLGMRVYVRCLPDTLDLRTRDRR